MNENDSAYSPLVAIIGAGPAGMMAAQILVKQGFLVNVYDAKPAVLRKFLVAGKGGLNLSRREEFEEFLSHYGKHRENLEKFLRQFGPQEVQQWVNELGFQTFTGSSRKIFPKNMNAVPIRLAWINHLRDLGVKFHLNHRWIGWNQDNNPIFNVKNKVVSIHPDAIILALGGASWPTTGSNGSWVEILENADVKIAPLQPANCGFNVPWTDHFREKFQGTPLKSIELHFHSSVGNQYKQRGEFIITRYGVEGSLIYAFSAEIRDEIYKSGKAVINIDLLPDWSPEQLIHRLSRPRGSRSISSHIEKSIGVSGVKAGLMWEFLPKEVILNPQQLAFALKSLPIPLIAPRPLEEAISTAGGVCFENLDNHLMVKSKPGIFIAGEMLDWEAPTGGYLLTACFSTGYAAANGVIQWIRKITDS